MSDSKAHRLFKVSKELNVPTNTLVDFLSKKGQQVVNDPNAKLSQDQYDTLVKEYASDKLLKEKADQSRLKQQTLRSPQTAPRPERKGDEHEEETGESPLSAEQLRISVQAPKTDGGIKKPTIIIPPLKPVGKFTPEIPGVPHEEKPAVVTPQMPTPEVQASVLPKAEMVVPQPQVVAPKAEPEAPKAEAPAPPAEKPQPVAEAQPRKEQPAPETPAVQQDAPKINITGKIELPPVAPPQEKKPQEQRQRPQDQNRRDQPRRDQPRDQNQSRDNNNRRNEPPKHDPRKQEPRKVIEPMPPREEPKKPEEFASISAALNMKAEVPDEQGVIRADDNVTKLEGLKVLGTVDLGSLMDSRSGGRNKRKRTDKGKGDVIQDDRNRNTAAQVGAGDPNAPKTPATPGSISAAAAAEEARKRKRKRKRKPGEGGGEQSAQNNTAGGNNNAGNNANRPAGQGPAGGGPNRPGGGPGNNRPGGNANGPRRGNNTTTASGNKREKVSQTDVNQSVKATLGQMGKGADRRGQNIRREKRRGMAERRDYDRQLENERSKVLEVTEFITANEFANLLGIPVTTIISRLFKELGMMVTINQRLDKEVMELVAEEYGFQVELVDVTEQELEDEDEDYNEEDLERRAPIITVMGHVDHGKTTLLDFLRKSNVAGGEAGGITQHIGAYEVKTPDGRTATFLDTPGHEAFTAMRARGAKVTDVAIIVIAADDAIMPTTREAINHAQAAGVKMVFAINKIDKPGADANRIRTQLAEMNLLVEEWGGEYQSQEIAAKFGTNVDLLLDKVLLEAEYLDVKAIPDRIANGTVIESRLDKGRGNVVTLLVQDGTLEVGDALVAGIHFGKIRAMIDQNGKPVESAGPSCPVQVLGLGGLPSAGDKFKAYTDESKAREIATRRQELFREQQFRQSKRLTLDEITRRRAVGKFEQLNIIVKADVNGSSEALTDALLRLSTEEVEVNVILKGVGAISESDVLLASASDAIIISFNVRPNAAAKTLAAREGVDIRYYSIIYDALDEVKAALEGLLSPEIQEEITGQAQVRDVFNITGVGKVAGCYVTEGKVLRNNPVRVIRDNVVIHTGKLNSLKRFKEDVKEAVYGFECGIQINNYNDIQEGDVIESYISREVKRKLD